MNIAFCKLGKSIKFASSFSPAGGDNEPGALLRLLANNNPDHTFYLIGKSDLRKVSRKEFLNLFPYDNVIDCWAEVKGKTKEENINHIVKYFDNLGFQPDAHVCMIGQVGTVTIPGKIQQVGNPDLIASVIDMTIGYSTPITTWMNEHQEVPIIEIINDPRYTLRQSRDIIPDPSYSLSQYDFRYEKPSIHSYDNQERKVNNNIMARYAGVEKIFLFDRVKERRIHPDLRNILFSVILNEGSPSRYDMLKEWVLDEISDVEIYGRWEDERALKDPRFKGSMQLEDIQKMLQAVRCTFIIPIAPGWVTSKYIEMIYAGVVPIFHPTYDEQNHLKYPEELRPKNKKEMLELVEKFKDDAFYEQTIRMLQDRYLKNKDFTGERLSKIIMTMIDRKYIAADLSKYKRVEAQPEGLESFFS